MPALVYTNRHHITTTLSQTEVEELCEYNSSFFVRLTRATGGYTMVNPASIVAIDDYPYDLEEDA